MTPPGEISSGQQSAVMGGYFCLQAREKLLMDQR